MTKQDFCQWLLWVLLALPLPAGAACSPTCTCTASATGVSFGSYDPLPGTPLDGTGNVRVSCTGIIGLLLSADYTIALNKGLYSASFSPRQMGSGTYRLNYDLYSDSGRSVIWGEGASAVSGTVTIPLLVGSGFKDNPVYGRISGGQQSAQPGGYSDTITVTVTYN